MENARRFREIIVAPLLPILSEIELHKLHGVSMDGTVEQRLVQIGKGVWRLQETYIILDCLDYCTSNKWPTSAVYQRFAHQHG